MSALVVLLATAVAAHAEPTSVSGDELRAMVPGSHIELDTPLRTVVPIRFGRDGLMTGEANSLAPVLGSERDRGRWRVSGDQLCLKWFRWFESEERCMSLRRDGNRIFWQKSDGDSGTATLIFSGEAHEPVARFTVAGVSPPASPATPPAAAPQPAAPDDSSAQAVVRTDSVDASVTSAPAANAATPPAPVAPNLANLSIISRAEAATPPPSSAGVDAHALAAGEAADTPATSAAKSDSAQTDSAAQPTKPRAAKAKAAPSKASASSTIAAATPTVKTVAAKGRVSSSKPISAPLYQVAGVDEDDVLNIRNGPSEEHDPIGEIPPDGRGVRIVGSCQADWCPIVHGETKGWVNRYYLTAEPAPETSAAARSARRPSR